MAQNSAMSGYSERALEELEEMIDHFDRMTEFTHVDFESVLLNTLSYDKSEVRRVHEENIYSLFLSYLERRIESFESIADTPRFIVVKQQLAEKAN